VSSYYTRWCAIHGEWDDDVDCPSECPECLEAGTAPSQLEKKEKDALRAELAALQTQADGWHRVVIDCERILGCVGDTASSPTMSNVPNLVRDAVIAETRCRDANEVQGKRIAALRAENARLQRVIDACKGAADTIQKALVTQAEEGFASLQAANARMREALRRAGNELGIPQPGYPAPVANAAEIIASALSTKPAGYVTLERLREWLGASMRAMQDAWQLLDVAEPNDPVTERLSDALDSLYSEFPDIAAAIRDAEAKPNA
jgi:hypothetical protein